MKQGKDISLELPGIFVIHQKIQGKQVDFHEHGSHEFFIPLQGEIRVNLLKTTEVLKAGVGKMIYIPPGVHHAFDSDRNAQGERLIFMIDEKTWKANEGGKFPAKTIAASQLGKELLFHMLLHPKAKGAGMFVSTLVLTLSEMLEEDVVSSDQLEHFSGKTDDERVKRALSEIRRGFSEELKMESIAKKSGLSLRNLNRLFMSELGVNPKQIVTLYRIEKAKRLLKNRKTTVTDVAIEVGYSSISQFIASFRKHTGKLPSEFEEHR